MTKITDKADLNDGTEYAVNLGAKTLQLAVAGNLSNDGVTGQALFSALHDLWKTGATHNRYRFPFYMVDGPVAQMLELRDGWEAADATTLTLLRDCGLAYKDASGTVTAEWMCLVQAGTLFGAGDQPYYLPGGETAPADFGFADEFNELVQIYGDGTHGNLDYRSVTEFGVFSREQGTTYGYYELVSAQQLSGLLPRAYMVPMTTADDPDVVASDATIDTTAPYTGMTLTTLAGQGFTAWANATLYAANDVVSDGGRWYITALGGTSSGTGVGDDTGVTDWAAYSGERDIDGTYYAYNRIINGNNGTKTQIRDWLQRQLRLTTDIDAIAGTQRGDIYTDATLEFSGPLLITSTGVFVDNYQSAEASDYRFTDVGGVQRSIAFVATFTLQSLDSLGAAVNWRTGTRVRIYDETNTSELYNALPGATDTVAVQNTSGGAASLSFKIISVNGSTDATLMITGTASIDASNVTVNVVQETDQVYVDNAVDGSAVTGITIAANKADIDINDADNTVSFQEIYAWYVDYSTSATGIAESDFLITANTQTDYTVDETVEVKNTKTGSPLTITGANVTDSLGATGGWIDLTGENIFLIPESVVPFSYSTGSGLDAAQDAKLTAINNQTAPLQYDSGRVLSDPGDLAIEGSLTVEQMFRLILASTAGKTTGGGTTTERFRDVADTKDRIVSTNDGTNRTGITLDGT